MEKPISTTTEFMRISTKNMDLHEDYNTVDQLNIPHTLPSLLRQYAKAAIRTQPADLLRWSATYFRCLSINCAPPVKSRLEYPVPDDWDGLTSGWVHSLYRQFNGSTVVEFEILLDRWCGACLQPHQLIKILCLGGFEDPSAVPCLKFISLCAGIISNSLTHTMLLVCEVLTEEPEGGSAAISADVFLDIYKFLAGIDASEGQWFKNRYFPNFGVCGGGKRVKFDDVVPKDDVCSESIGDLPSLDYDTNKEGFNLTEDHDEVHNENKDISHQDITEVKDEALHQGESPKENSRNTISNAAISDENNGLKNDEENNEQKELHDHEDDSDQEKHKDETSEEEKENFSSKLSEKENNFREVEDTLHNSSHQNDECEEVYVDPAPGIGPKVPRDMVEEFEKYVRHMGKIQNGAIMPRNLKHFECPNCEELV